MEQSLGHMPSPATITRARYWIDLGFRRYMGQLFQEMPRSEHVLAELLEECSQHGHESVGHDGPQPSNEHLPNGSQGGL